MPYKSKAQAAYFNIHKKELEKQGVDVDEWNHATKGKKLPKKKASTTKTSGTRSSTTSSSTKGTRSAKSSKGSKKTKKK